MIKCMLKCIQRMRVKGGAGPFHKGGRQRPCWVVPAMALHVGNRAVAAGFDMARFGVLPGVAWA